MILNQFALENQVALITGGGAGIGRAIAELFAQAGAKVVVSDLDRERAREVADAIGVSGGHSIGTKCDVTDDSDCRQLVENALDAFGSLTILVNNAGGGGPKPFEMSMEEFRWAFKLNVFSMFRLSQLSVPYMERAGRGCILNISSMAGENKNIRMTSYGSSKAAVNHLTRNMAFDLGPKGIRVNAIAPGAIRTGALETVLNPEIEKSMLRNTPLARLGEPSDIANAALFLCSPASSWISGQILTVSGGGTQELG